MATTSLRRSSILDFVKSDRISGKPPGIGAEVASTTGSPTITTYTDVALNEKYNVYVFNGAGSITFKRPGFARILTVGGGGGGCGFNSSKAAAGGGGGIRWGSFEVAATSYTINVGPGGTGLSGQGQSGSGGNSGVVGIVLSAGARGGRHKDSFSSEGFPGFGGDGGTNGLSNGDGLALGGGAGGLAYGTVISGITFDWSGASIEYGLGQNTSLNVTRNGTANTGECGRYTGNGGSGRVIVMVEV